MKNLLVLIFLGVGVNIVAFQDQGEIIHVAPTEAIEGNSLTLEAIYTGSRDGIASAKILYRLAGQVGFLEQDLNVGEFKLTGDLPGEVIGAPGMEYVLVVNLKNGGIVAFPNSDDPLSNPQFIAVEEPPNQDQRQLVGDDFGEIVILTPDPGSSIPYGEPLIVAVSLFSLENVDIGSIRIYFDNVDVTAYSLITTDLITYKPDALGAGRHNVFIEVSNIYGVKLSSSSWSFSIRSQAQQIFELKMNGSFNLSHRQDRINTTSSQMDSVIAGDTVSVPVYSPVSQTVNRMDFMTNLNFDWANVKIFTNLTSKEDTTLQPQNRYGIKVRTSWLRYTFGDDTPMMNRLALWGKRVRGHNLDIRFKGFNLHVVSGKTARSVTGIADFDMTSSEWSRTGYTFERGLFAIRPSFGTGTHFQAGLFYVHTRDSVNSVRLKPGLWDESIFSEMVYGEGDSVLVPFGANTYTLGDSTYNVDYFLRGSNPEDNIVIGSDLKLAFDEHRFVMEGSAAFSFYNRNILDGPLTRSQLDTFGLLQDTTYDDTLGSGTIGLALTSLDEAFSGMSFLLTNGQFDPANLADFFILNENITLPVDLTNLEENNYLKALTTLGLHMAIKLNYYDNFIQMDFHHVGPGYKALGSPVLRVDGKGWNGWKITDRIRMLNNMLYLNLSYESYKNNTTSRDPVEDPRLYQNSYSAGLTLNPGNGLPTITTNMKYFTRDNNVDDVTELIQTLSTGPDTTIIDNRELNESLSSNVNLTYLMRTGMVHNTISFNIMRSNMDNLITGYEGQLRASNLYGLILRSEWQIPLTTTLTIRNNSNELYDLDNPSYQSSTFNTYNIGASYRLLSGSLILRSNVQILTFDAKKYENNELVSSQKTQTNFQLNSQYNIPTVNISETSIKSRIIGSYEQRRYVSEYTDYSDNMISARLEMTF